MAHAINEVFKERISKNLDWTKLPPPENRVMKHDRLGFNINSPMHAISKEAAARGSSKGGSKQIGGSKERRASKFSTMEGGATLPGMNALALLGGRSPGQGDGTWDHDPTLRISNSNPAMGSMMQRRASREAGGIQTVPIRYDGN